jgi:uncharacterized protein
MTSVDPDGSMSQPPAAPEARRPSRWRAVFLGPNGMRAGWRIAIFVAITYLLSRTVNYLVFHIPPIRERLQTANGVMTPAGQLFALLPAAIVLTSAAIMTRIERRSFADYGLPWSQAFQKRFWQGVPLGFVMLCLLLGLIAAFGGLSIAGTAVSGSPAVIDGLFYVFGFICVGIFEEFAFRGYLQSTLGSGIGFWPAAIVLSVLFGAAHLGNPGEAQIGAVMAGSFGLLSAFALRRTGNLWFSIGMHASWDWGETYFFGTPDSGLLAQGHLLNTTFHGPQWLTGGSIGPEGSLFVFVVLLAWAAIIHFWFRRRGRESPAADGRSIRGEVIA